MSARLVWEREGEDSVSFPLEGESLVVGRDEHADVRIDAPLVSRAHARLERRGEAWHLVDLGSTNATRVNDEFVERRQLKDGDEISFARARCRFVAD